MNEDWHGTSGGYTNHHCRCQDCRDGWAAFRRARGYQATYRARLRAAGLLTSSSFTNPVPKNKKKAS